jgi:hypothetical protein|nr:MAG TPA: ParB protein [Caudoviricetes sp.]
MKIQSVKLKDIFPYYDNPRDNTDAIEPVKESFNKFGFIKPIICDQKGVIICGHTRYVAAFQLGLEYVPVIYSNMNDEEAKKFRIADNKLAEKSEFDEDELLEELRKMEVPTEMQAFFFEDIDHMLNFDIKTINAQAEEMGGFMNDYEDTENTSYDQENYGTEEPEEFHAEGENGESVGSSSDEELDPAENLFVLQTREDGTHFMKVVCPYCGNIEVIDIED